ncbi:MAG: uroporphyrinogen decarboxylase [Armatimonadetes bacterium]|nr:uroporphyrinogen decarboxylase [Armatimonadota bacterium]
MTRRERVIAAINHRQPDICPYTVDLTSQAYERLVDYVGDPGYVERIGQHILAAHYGWKVENPPGSGYWRDHFGVVWNKNGVDKDIGVVENYLISEPTLAVYEFPKVDVDAIRRSCEALLATSHDTFTVFNIGFSMFERAWTLRGMENLLVDMVSEPSFVHDLLDAICEFNLCVMEEVLKYPIDGFMFGDDWGQQRGTIMGAPHWREFLKPRMKRLYERAKQAGKYVLQHSCGDIHELLPDLIEIGLDVYQTFQPEIYDVKAVKREFGRDLTFWGGISTQRVLPWVTPEEVKKVAREMIATVGEGGGYIAAPTHSIPGDVPPANIVALIEAFQSQ